LIGNYKKPSDKSIGLFENLFAEEFIPFIGWTNSSHRPKEELARAHGMTKLITTVLHGKCTVEDMKDEKKMAWK
jgi:hypothetical protein